MRFSLNRRSLHGGSSSCESVMKETLSLIEKTKNLNFMVGVREAEDLIEDAKQCDIKKNSYEKRSPIDGFTLAVKDNFCTKNMPTTCASKMLANYRPTFNATVVNKAESAGAIVIGKTNMDEFAMGSGTVDSIFGPTKNPWNSQQIKFDLVIPKTGLKIDEQIKGSSLKENDFLISGGSSGGSAVAVATGAARIGLGSDTGGSVRIPGAWTGVTTLKPTYGALSRHGMIPLVNSLDTPGLFARSVEDITSFFNVLSGPDEKDATTLRNPIENITLNQEQFDPSVLTIGIPQEYHCQDMADSVLETWSMAADLLEKHSVKLVNVSLPHTRYALTCYSILNACEVASNMSRYDGLEYGLRGSDETSLNSMYSSSRGQGFSETVRGRIIAGNYFLLAENYETYFGKAMQLRRLIQQDFIKAFQEVDLLLTPATVSAAPKFSDFSDLDNRTQVTKQDYCTQPVNLSGLPAATVPVRLSEDGLPLSLQLIAPFRGESRLLQLCHWLEQRFQFPHMVIS